MNVTAIIAAGGRGHRLGASVPKQFLRLGGRTVLQWSVDAFGACGLVQELVVVMPPESDIAGHDHPIAPTTLAMTVVAGGRRRQDSVANGVAAVDPAADVIVIHDGARPFVTPKLIARTIDAAATTGAAIAALRATETVKRTDQRVGEAWVVAETLVRDDLVLVQTPQAFRREVLLDALSRGADEWAATDEAMLVERAGHPVRVVEGDRANVKITTPEDLEIARRLVGDERDVTFRTGIGYDIHRTCEGRPLRLGGIEVPWTRGLLGHSDADVLCHAITDAVLGAAGAGDIGRHFPDTDDAWKDASSLDLLRRAMVVVTNLGFVVENVDAVVIAEQPKIAPYADRMRATLAPALGVDATRVSVKGTTHEGLGAVGRQEAMAAQAVAMLRKVPGTPSVSDATRSSRP